MDLFFSHGRIAFKYGLIQLGFDKKDKIMLPEYICDILLDPLKDLGIKPIFYQINKDFTTNWKSLKKKYVNSVKAIVIVNYFGFEEKKFFFNYFYKKKKIFLIEDNCHSLKIKSKKINNSSDFTFFSIQKLVKKTYSGGILRMKKKFSNSFYHNKKLKKYNVGFKVFLNNFLENNFLRFKRFLKFKFLNMPNFSKLNSIKNERIIEDCIIDDYSKLTFEKTDLKKIRQKRLKNYFIWEKFCKKNKSIEIIKRKFNKDNIPWVYPAYINDPKIRKKLFKYGWKNGYSITSWPSLPRQLVNNRNKNIWKKLVCFNTDRAPTNKSIDFD